MANKSREDELEREGWTRQFTVDEPRLSEAVEMYKLLGFEVHLEPMVSDEDSEECAALLFSFWRVHDHVGKHLTGSGPLCFPCQLWNPIYGEQP